MYSHLITTAAAVLSLSLFTICHLPGAAKGDHVMTGKQPGAAQADIVGIAASTEGFSQLVAAVKQAGLVEALSGPGPITVFAPTDAAFAALPEGTLAKLSNEQLATILKHHVVAGAVPAATAVKLTKAESLAGLPLIIEAGKGVTVGGATVIKTDIHASNGVIHVIDRVILPPSEDIVGTAVAAGQFKTLAGALGQAGLVEALQGEGPFTVFAPSDAAFAKLPAGTLESLNKEQLTAILKLHVVPGLIVAGDAVAAVGGEVPTLNGTKLAVTQNEDGSLAIGGAKIVATDVLSTNGVIHVIDSVILP